MNPKFASPDQGQDKKFLEEEARRKGFDWKTIFWKPAPTNASQDVDNVVRLLPAREGSGATYHMKIGKHFIRHADNDVEAMICMEDTYGQPCPACDRRRQIYAAARERGDSRNLTADEKKELAKFALKKLGVFNVVDRIAYQDFRAGKLDKLPKVLLWEAPRKLCWERIVRNVVSRGRTSNLFDEYDDKGAVTKAGRDVLIKFYPDSDPGAMYDVQYIEPIPLGEPEEVEAWYEQIIDIIPEGIALYQPISIEEANTKCFGTKEERTALREAKAKAAAEANEAKGAEEEEEEEEAEVEQVKPEAEAEAEVEEKPKAAPAADKKAAELAKRLADVKGQEASLKEKAAPEATKPPSTSGTDDLKARIAAVRERVAKGKS